jgi:hypothetical protein
LRRYICNIPNGYPWVPMGFPFLNGSPMGDPCNALIVDAIFAIVLRNFGEFFYGCMAGNASECFKRISIFHIFEVSTSFVKNQKLSENFDQ